MNEWAEEQCAVSKDSTDSSPVSATSQVTLSVELLLPRLQNEHITTSLPTSEC